MDLMGVFNLKERKVSAAESENVKPIILDVAGGTGDMTIRMLAKIKEKRNSALYNATLNNTPAIDSFIEPKIVVVDINESMLKIGKQKVESLSGNLIETEFVQSDAQQLTFADNSIDSYTISFGIRNVTDVSKALREAYRVLKPRGKIFVLEFSNVNNCAMQRFYSVYSKVIPIMGKIVANDEASYK